MRFKTLSALVIAGGLTFLSATAHADGAIIASNAIPAKARTALSYDIAAAKSSRPAAFARVHSLFMKLGKLDKEKRGRLAVISPALKRMGSDALMPMLEQIAMTAEPRGTLNDSAWLSWRVSLLEAVGSLRIAKTLPVLQAVLEGPAADFLVKRAASQALAKLNSDIAASTLIALSASTSSTSVFDSAQRAVFAGMGHCRRTVVANHLAASMRAASRADAILLSRALGDVGNAWAWETPYVKSTGEEMATRSVAAEALIEAYVAHDHARTRKALTQAILVVDHPSTKTFIAQARAHSSANAQAALDVLELRFDDSPFHR